MNSKSLVNNPQLNFQIIVNIQLLGDENTANPQLLHRDYTLWWVSTCQGVSTVLQGVSTHTGEYTRESSQIFNSEMMQYTGSRDSLRRILLGAAAMQKNSKNIVALSILKVHMHEIFIVCFLHHSATNTVNTQHRITITSIFKNIFEFAKIFESFYHSSFLPQILALSPKMQSET
jgi:hypothetical protein